MQKEWKCTRLRPQKSRSPRRHEEEWEPFGLTSVHLSHQFGFRDATLWCWKCGGWSAGSRRASRLKNPCGFPSKTGADVVHRVSEDTRLNLTYGDPMMFLEPLSASRSSRIPITRGSDHKSSSKTIAPRELNCLFANLLGIADQGMALPGASLRWLLCPCRVRTQNA